MECFLLRLQGCRVCEDEEDKLVWIGAKNGNFFVKDLYKELESRRQLNFPSNIIWNSWVPPKVGVFAWEATWNKVLTLDHIQRKGWVVANRCFLCCKEEELVDHILLHYDKTRAVWHSYFRFLVSWVLFSSVRGAYKLTRVFCG